MGLTVDGPYHSGIKDGSDRAIGFSGLKQPPSPLEKLAAARRLDITRALRMRAPMRKVKS